MLISSGLAQAPQSLTPPAPAESEPAAPPPQRQPGLFDALGRWFSNSADAAKDATGTMMTLPGTNMVSGSQICPLAPNNAPDCSQGADALCRSKGYASGRQLEINASQKCRPKIRFSGGPHLERNCKTETFVIRAVCQ